jgi:hypothetical protein
MRARGLQLRRVARGGAPLPADTTAPLPEARQTGTPMAREVDPNSWRGWGELGEHYGRVEFV